MTVHDVSRHEGEPPDEGDDTGMSEEEYLELNGRISELGGDNLRIEKIEGT